MTRSLVIGLLAIAALIAACKDAGETSDPCPGGICGGPGGTSSSSGGGCTEAWTCTPWAQGSDGLYTRTCSDENACGTTSAKPPEGPIALPDLDMDFYKCNVEPIVDRNCSMMGCHGSNERLYKVFARGRLRNDEVVAQVSSCPVGPQTVNLQDEGSGTVMCVGWSPHTDSEWQQNYDSARSFMIGISDPSQSELLRQPLKGGSFPHAGAHFWSEADGDYQTILAWLGGATLGMPCDPGDN